jgi:hypothetical protein
VLIGALVSNYRSIEVIPNEHRINNRLEVGAVTLGAFWGRHYVSIMGLIAGISKRPPETPIRGNPISGVMILRRPLRAARVPIFKLHHYPTSFLSPLPCQVLVKRCWNATDHPVEPQRPRTDVRSANMLVKRIPARAGELDWTSKVGMP